MSSAGTYRSALDSAIGSALAAGFTVGAADVLLTLKGASGVRADQAGLFALVSLSLYAGVALLVGLGEGVLAGAFLATHPDGTPARLWRRLQADRALDRSLTAGILAGCASAAAYAGVVAVLAMRLVAQPERKLVGAVLLGGFAVAALPVVLLAFYPLYRAARRVARAVPALGPVPAAFLTAGLLAVGAAGAGMLFIMSRLDWRVMSFGAPVSAGAFLVAQIAWLALFRRFRARPRLLLCAALVALAAPVVGVAAARPDARTVALLTVESRATRTLVGIARSLFDRDGDGYSTVLGGGDCDDHNRDIHPGGHDIPDNGIDENCLGGDAHKAPVVAAPTPTPAAGGFHWDGNVLIIAVDTLRADRLGVAGYLRRGGRSLTPRIDALAQKSTYFRRVYAQAPNTPRSFPSIFTSRFPSQVRWDNVFQNYSKLLPANVTLFEALSAGGIHTAGISSHFYFTAERGITKGFDEYDNEGAKNIKDSNHDSASPRTTPRVVAKLAALAAAKQRFVLFTHLFEPHSTYMEHEGFPIHEKGLEGLEEKYDEEIAYVDGYVGQILDGLAAAGLDKTTMVVLLSDHGEAFGDHRIGGERMFFHGQTLYEELLRVPVIIYVPGAPARTVDSTVMLIDVAPTILAALGLPIPQSFEGKSLVPALTGAPLEPRPAFAELLPAPEWNHDARAMIDADGRSKLIYRTSDNLFELYDVLDDPREQKNLIDDRRDLGQKLKERLTSWLESQP